LTCEPTMFKRFTDFPSIRNIPSPGGRKTPGHLQARIHAIMASIFWACSCACIFLRDRPPLPVQPIGFGVSVPNPCAGFLPNLPPLLAQIADPLTIPAVIPHQLKSTVLDDHFLPLQGRPLQSVPSFPPAGVVSLAGTCAERSSPGYGVPWARAQPAQDALPLADKHPSDPIGFTL